MVNIEIILILQPSGIFLRMERTQVTFGEINSPHAQRLLKRGDIL